MCDFGDFTLFDIFLKKSKVYLNLSINNKVLNKNDLIVKMNSKELEHISSIVKDEYEPTLIFIYNGFQYDKEIKFEVIYKERKEVFSSKKVKIDKKYFLTLTTLFKNDYKLFPVFYDYYKNQGVEHFFMYYNGKINNEIKKIINKKDVSLIEWDFRFFNNKDQYKYLHHAQLGQMHNAIYKYGKDICKYMIFCDLDEYLYIKNYKLKNFIMETDKDLYGFCNIWSKSIDNFPNKFPNNFLTSNKNEYETRSKNIYKLDKVETISIHVSHKFNTNNISSILDLEMFHFYNWSKKNRIIESDFTPRKIA